jgi:hypothetical protein
VGAVKFKHASGVKLVQLEDNRLRRQLRGTVRHVRGRGPLGLFMALQHKYPWPRPLRGRFGEHHAFLRATEARLHRMHRAYRGRR